MPRINPTTKLDQQIHLNWPERWHLANDAGSKASKLRTQLRREYRQHLEFRDFRKRNPDAFCSNCDHGKVTEMFVDRPLTCDLDSDYSGFAVVDLDRVCVRWRRKQ